MADVPIDEQMMDALRAYARQVGRTPEEVAQEAIAHFLRDVGQTPPPTDDDAHLVLSDVVTVEPEIEPTSSSAEDEFLALVGIGHSGQHDVSERADDILKTEIDPLRGWTFKRDRTD